MSNPTASIALGGALPRTVERPSSHRRALISLSLSMFLSSLDTSIANVALPTLAAAFHASFQAVQWIVLAYLLAVTALIVSVGRLGDLVGRRRLLLGGLAVFTAASLLCGVAPTLSLLIVARAVQGIGAATMMALSIALIGETVPKENTGSAMGLLGTMSAIGTAIGPSAGGLLIAACGWRSIFLVNVPLALAALFLAIRFVPADAQRSAQRPRFDHVGTLLLSLSLGAYALSMTLGRGHFGGLNIALLMVGLAGLGAFVLAERRAESPLIRLSVFRNPALTSSLMTAAVVATVMMATLVVGPFYLARGLGLQAALVGFALSVGPLVAAISSFPAGRIVDRFGARTMSIAGLAGIAIASLILTIVPRTLGVPGYVIPIAMMTASYALFQTANNAAVLTSIAAEQRGVISGMLSLARNAGLITGASVMGAVFAHASHAIDLTTAHAADVAQGMRTTFVVAALLMAVALAAAIGARVADKRAAS